MVIKQINSNCEQVSSEHKKMLINANKSLIDKKSDIENHKFDPDLIRYNPNLKQELINKIESYFKRFVEKYPISHVFNSAIVPFGKRYFINYSCGFNNPNKIGCECSLVATDDYYCMVTFNDDASTMQMYRCEDLTVIEP